MAVFVELYVVTYKKTLSKKFLIYDWNLTLTSLPLSTRPTNEKESLPIVASEAEQQITSSICLNDFIIPMLKSIFPPSRNCFKMIQFEFVKFPFSLLERCKNPFPSEQQSVLRA